MTTIAENLRRVKTRMSDVASSCGRAVDELTLVAVSKTFGEDAIRSAVEEGHIDFGENYTAEFRRKAISLADQGIRWHFVGHLQSNKVKEIIGKTFLIHSLDRDSLAKELQRKAEAADLTVDALVEVHTTDEASKGGVMPAQLPGFLSSLAAYDRLRIRGLMTMGPFTGNPEDARPCFRMLRELRDRARQSTGSEILNELSMGMTSDFEVAIQEGATILRIGTAIFGERTRTAA